MTEHSSTATAELYDTRALSDIADWLAQKGLAGSAKVVRDAAAALSVVVPAQGARVPKVRTNHHRNKEEAERLQEIVAKRYQQPDPAGYWRDVYTDLLKRADAWREALDRIIDLDTVVSDGGKVHDHGRCAEIAIMALAFPSTSSGTEPSAPAPESSR